MDVIALAAQVKYSYDVTRNLKKFECTEYIVVELSTIQKLLLVSLVAINKEVNK